MSLYYPFFKRALDIVFSFSALVALSPIFVIISLLITVKDKGPPFFFQERIGKGFTPFRLIKFRTMSTEKQPAGNGFDPGNIQRVTRVGAFLRRTKLDELPELFNLLRNDMSIVGPRPEVRKYVEAFPDPFLPVLSVKPGLSDEASIKYRSEEALLAAQPNPDRFYREIILPDKLQLAGNYVKNITFKKDLTIVIKTVQALFE